MAAGVTCASKSLTEVEKRYSQTDREALAIRWAYEKCYMYLIGSQFTIETDHQPLLPIFNNPHSRPPMRIERWLLYLQQFDFELKFCPGKSNPADYISRHTVPLSEEDEKTANARDLVIRSIIQDTTPIAIRREEIVKETHNDRELRKLAQHIQSSHHRAGRTEKDLKQYSQVFQELSYIDGLVMRGSQIVIPKSLRNRVVDLRHEGHLGIVKTKQLLRSKVWFPGIDKLVERKIASCLACQACVNTSKREPLQMSPTPNGPWLQTSADFCGPFPTGEMALVVLDAYSKYPEVDLLSSTSAAATLPALERIFSIHGIPEVMKTDNGPPFNSQNFKDFAEEKGFIHQKITPLWPEANGHVENFMKNLGKVAKTAKAEGKDWKKELYVFLGNYRATPHSSTGKSPHRLLMNRDVNMKLPSSTKSVPDSEVVQRDQEAKAKMKAYADKARGTQPPNFKVGEAVLVKQKRKNKASSAFEPTRYTIESINGSMISARRATDKRLVTRNSSFFKRMGKPPESPSREQLDFLFDDEEPPKGNSNPLPDDNREEPNQIPPIAPDNPPVQKNLEPPSVQYSQDPDDRSEDPHG